MVLCRRRPTGFATTGGYVNQANSYLTTSGDGDRVEELTAKEQISPYSFSNVANKPIGFSAMENSNRRKGNSKKQITPRDVKLKKLLK